MKNSLIIFTLLFPIIGNAQDVFQLFEAGTLNPLDKDHTIDLGLVSPSSTELIEFDIGVDNSCFGGTNFQGTITEISSNLGFDNVFNSSSIPFSISTPGVFGFSQNVNIPASPTQDPGRAFLKIESPDLPTTFVYIVYYFGISDCVTNGSTWNNKFTTCEGTQSCPGFCPPVFEAQKAGFCGGGSLSACYWSLNLFHCDGAYELQNNSGSSAFVINGPFELPYKDWLMNDDGLILGEVVAYGCEDSDGNSIWGDERSLVYIKISDKYCEGKCGDLTIEENTVWDAPKILPANLKIQPGKTLTIKSKVYIAEQKRIMVEPGARLLINGGHLTNNCDDKYWFGVEVWGDRNKWQSLQNQGYVSVRNAIIEKAQNALTTKRQNCPSGWDWNSTGGIIQATNSNFINNRRSAEFLSFQNFHPLIGNELNNQSFFSSCNFILDDDYSYPGGKSPQITMWNVRGVDAIGCTFEDTRTTLAHSSEAGVGIGTIGASFRVVPGCSTIIPIGQPCPAANVIPSVFKNLEYGVQASELDIDAPDISIKKSQFINNKVGINFDFILNQSEVLQNTFEIWHPFSDCGNDTDYGLVLDNSKNFIVQENAFSENQSTSCIVPRTVGIRAEDTGELPNEIYKNSFDGLSIGNWARGKNRNIALGGLLGLEYWCNTNSNNEIDFQIDGTDPMDGVKLQQGNINLASGNTFSNPPTNLWNIFRGGTLNTGMVYFYENSPNHYPDQTNFFVNPTMAPANACKSKIPVFTLIPVLGMEILEQPGSSYDKDVLFMDTASVFRTLQGTGETIEIKENLDSELILSLSSKTLSTTYDKARNEQQLFDLYIKLSPNPTKGRVSIEIDDNHPGNGWIEVFDIHGKKVMNDISYQNKVTTINLENLIPATYVIKITIGNQVFSGKIIKQ